jgi:hypothetical protein
LSQKARRARSAPRISQRGRCRWAEGALGAGGGDVGAEDEGVRAAAGDGFECGGDVELDPAEAGRLDAGAGGDEVEQDGQAGGGHAEMVDGDAGRRESLATCGARAAASA